MSMIIFLITSILYLVVVIALAFEYDRKYIKDGFWAVVILLCPIINFIVLLYLISDGSLKNFIDELRKARHKKLK